MTTANDASAITNPAPRAPRGLRAKLLAAVRSEFRVEVVFVSPADPVLGGAACLVTACERVARRDGLCHGHARVWKVEGKPDVAVFAATTDPTIFTHRPYVPCLVHGCGYGRSSVGLCDRHHGSRRRSGFSDVQRWLKESAPTSTMQPRPLCRVQACGVWAEPDRPLCIGHLRRWRFHGQPDIEEFSTTVSLPTRERVDLTVLEPHLRLEMQYVLQQRNDDPMSMARLRPSELQKVSDILAGADRSSLLAWSDEEWQQFVKREVTPNIRYVRAFLTHAREQIENLQYGTGWDVEYPRSVWRLRNVGADAPGTAMISFVSIRQPWLVDIVKRWTQWRIGRGLHPATAGKRIRAVAILGRFLAARRPEVDALSKVTRAILEAFLADFHASGAKPGYRVGMISALGIFLSDIRRHRWDTTLPADAMFYPEDSPKLPSPLPRALAEQIMAQVEKPENLSLFGNPTYELLTLILIRCGLRVTDGARLPFDCIVTDAESAPYLRYYNHKMKREALVPIDEELQRLIVEQQQRSLQQWPKGVPVLFPRPTTNREGRKAISGATYRPALRAWLQRCDVRDELGQPVNLTPHQWRHTFGTTLINRDVPQEIVRRLLDHESLQMTARYAILHDATVRRHWEQARKVNISGDTVVLDPDGAVADAAWAKQRLSRATQALPNGYCGLPLARSCPHANACLACPMFLTTAEFLPEHRSQRMVTLQIITKAEAEGHARLAEMNRQVADNLERIITALEADDPEPNANGS